MSIYDNYEPTGEDIMTKELGGSQHHHTKRSNEKKQKSKRWRGNDALDRALDRINSDIRLSH